MYHITDAEWEVMRVIWTHDSVKSSQIISILTERGWSDSTIRTLLTRLVDKGLVTSQRDGRAFIYQTDLTEEEVYQKELDGLLERICATKHKALAKYFLKNLSMTERDWQDLHETLDSQKANLVEEIICQCLPGQCPCLEHEKGDL